MELYNRHNTLLLDFQYLRGNGNQIFIKELGYMFTNSIVPEYFLFKPPYDEAELTKRTKSQNDFNYQYINGLSWNSGYLDYNNLRKVLKFDDTLLVLVKGYEKKRFLEKYISNVKAIEMPGRLTSYDSFLHNCPTHPLSYNRCVLNHLFQMLIYLEKNNKFIDNSSTTEKQDVL